MIAELIGFVLRNFPAFLLVAALLIAAMKRDNLSQSERFLSWILLLPVGVSGLWAALFHLFFPGISAADIGWQPSPFQFEVGMADLAIGATAVASFWCSLPFKIAAVWVSSIFLLGDAVGHVHQMLAAGNFASGNAGTPFILDLIAPILSILLSIMAYRHYLAGRRLRMSV
jgi:uncharacterized membrane protein